MSLKNHFVRNLSLATCLSVHLGGASLIAQEPSHDGAVTQKEAPKTKAMKRQENLDKKLERIEMQRQQMAEHDAQLIVNFHMNKKVGGIVGRGYLGAHDQQGYKNAIESAKKNLLGWPEAKRKVLEKLKEQYELSKAEIDQRGNDNIFRTNASHHHDEIQKALKEFEAHIQQSEAHLRMKEQKELEKENKRLERKQRRKEAKKERSDEISSKYREQEHKEEGVDHHSPSKVPSKPDHLTAPSHLKEQQPVHGGTHGGH